MEWLTIEWTPTNHFRWLEITDDDKRAKGPVAVNAIGYVREYYALQQMWQSKCGQTEWRDVDIA